MQLLGINARLYEHTQNDPRVYEIAVKFDAERMPIVNELERLEGMDAPLMERVERTADLLTVYARALSALAAN